MKSCPYLLHALSPLHAGTGQAVDVIDLPIARMRATNIPLVPGSSVKGVLREARVEFFKKDTEKTLYKVFGPLFDDNKDDQPSHAGALVVGDARLLAMPVRSFKGVFAWVTSPLLLELARRDCIDLPNIPTKIPSVEPKKALVSNLNLSKNKVVDKGKDNIFLEDLNVEVTEDQNVRAWTQFFAPYVQFGDDNNWFENRFVVVDDEIMAFLWETSTQVDTRIKINQLTRTVEEGALWVEESLPPETLLIGLLTADKSRRKGTELSPEEVLKKALPGEEILQFGGKATVGKGRCRITPMIPQNGTKPLNGAQ